MLDAQSYTVEHWLDQRIVHGFIEDKVFSARFQHLPSVERIRVLKHYIALHDESFLKTFLSIRQASISTELRQSLLRYLWDECPSHLDWFLSISKNNAFYHNVFFVLPDRNWRKRLNISWSAHEDIQILKSLFHASNPNYGNGVVRRSGLEERLLESNWKIFLAKNGLNYVWIKNPSIEQAVAAALTKNNPVLDYSLLSKRVPGFSNIIHLDLMNPFSFIREHCSMEENVFMPLDL